VIGAWVVAAIFFAVYDMAIDTIFFCFRKSNARGYLIELSLLNCSFKTSNKGHAFNWSSVIPGGNVNLNCPS
jgi:hypothetical protein